MGAAAERVVQETLRRGVLRVPWEGQPMNIEERWTRYVMKMECKRCGNPIYDDEDTARDDVKEILKNNDFGRAPEIEDLRGALTWLPHEGRWCDWCHHMMNKDC